MEDPGAPHRPLDPHPASWYAQRLYGLGGSEVATIVGFDRYKSPLQLYKLKRGEAAPDPASAYTVRGHMMEPWIARRLRRATGARVLEGLEFHRHPGWEEGVRIQANLDGLIAPPPSWGLRGLGLFEAKSVSCQNDKAPIVAGGQVPLTYQIQIQTYLSCIPRIADYALLGAVLGPSGPDPWRDSTGVLLVLLTFPNPPLQELLIQLAWRFWRAVERGERPRYRFHPWANRIKAMAEQTRSRLVFVERAFCLDGLGATDMVYDEEIKRPRTQGGRLL